MKQLLLILPLLLTITARSQQDPAQLAQQITQKATTDREKISAIFQWVTDNIDYRTKMSFKSQKAGNASKKFISIDDPTDTGALKPLNERVAETVLTTRLATCEGYSRLFTTLCDFAGVRSELIVGYAGGGYRGTGSMGRFGVNHYWNAVMIDSNWYLLDVTWSAGYVSRAGEFIREYEPKYFMADPVEFIRDHYPDDIRWTLLPTNKVPVEFAKSPFLQKSYSKYSINSFYPKKGIIEAMVGDTLQFKLSTTDAGKDKNIVPDLLVDSAIYSHSATWIFLKPNEASPNNELPGMHSYSLPVLHPGIEWVYLMYNDDMVLRYKVNVKLQKDMALRQ